MTKIITNAPAALPAPQTFVPAISFTGYPDGVTETNFVAGQESQLVSAEFIELVRSKGLIAGSASR